MDNVGNNLLLIMFLVVLGPLVGVFCYRGLATFLHAILTQPSWEQQYTAARHRIAIHGVQSKPKPELEPREPEPWPVIILKHKIATEQMQRAREDGRQRLAAEGLGVMAGLALKYMSERRS